MATCLLNGRVYRCDVITIAVLFLRQILRTWQSVSYKPKSTCIILFKYARRQWEEKKSRTCHSYNISTVPINNWTSSPASMQLKFS